MYQVNDDDIQDMAELHLVLESIVKAAKEKYTNSIILSALSITLIDLIRELSTDRAHFISAKHKFSQLIDMDAKRFYG